MTIVLASTVCGVVRAHWQTPLGQDAARQEDSRSFGDDEVDVCNESSLPADTSVRMTRMAKNKRYNVGGPDLRRLDARESFGEQVWPSTPWVPVDDSAVIVLGTLKQVATFLSDDGSTVYTEYTVAPEQILKADSARNSAADDLTIDRPGGFVRMAEGRVVGSATSRCYLGRLRLGHRYLVFAVRIHAGADLEMIRGFELSAGRVLELIPRDRTLPTAFSTERALLSYVEDQVRNSKTGPN